jgi:ligand-binding sensor domain-containing protein
MELLFCIINRKKHKMDKPLYKMKMLTIAVLLIMMSSCTGQVESKSESNTPLVVGSAKADEFKDPLFYIDGQLCQHLREIYQDRKGNLWFGTNVYDLMMYDGDELVYITEKEGFSGGRVTGIAEDSAGNIWFATGFGLNKYDGKSFTIFTDKDGLANSEIWSLHIDSKGIIWIGHNEGLSRFDGEIFERIVIPKPQVEEPNTVYSPNRITGISEDNAGNLWLGTDGYGISRYDGETFVHFTEADGLCDNTIYDLMRDSKGNIWIGTFWGGVCKYDGETFTNYTKDGIIKGDEAGGFFEDNNGDIWFGVENNGVYRYDGKHFSHYYKEEGLDASVLSIYRDRESRFWFGGWGGLFRYQDDRFSPVTRDGPWE